jgi:hypothetical protein
MYICSCSLSIMKFASMDAKIATLLRDSLCITITNTAKFYHSERMQALGECKAATLKVNKTSRKGEAVEGENVGGQ